MLKTELTHSFMMFKHKGGEPSIIEIDIHAHTRTHALEETFFALRDIYDSSFHLEAMQSLIGNAVISRFSWASEDKWPH